VIAPAVIFGLPCRVCGKAVTPSVDDIVGGDDLRGHICETCYADEQKAYATLLDLLAVQPTQMARCAECLKTADQLGGKLYMHVAAGVAELLCRRHSDALTARMSTATAAGRFKHLSKEEMMARMVREHWRRLRKGMHA